MLFSACIENDRSFGCFMINQKNEPRKSYNQQIHFYLQHVQKVITLHNAHKHLNNEELSMLPLYKYKIHLNSKVLSYLLNSTKMNVLVYDNNFRVVCVIFSDNKEYIHAYKKTKCELGGVNEYNPWRHQSIINWYRFLSVIHPDVSDIFTYPSSNCFASYNHYIRICIGYEYHANGEIRAEVEVKAEDEDEDEFDDDFEDEGVNVDKICIWSKSVFLDRMKFHSVLDLYSKTVEDLNVQLPKYLPFFVTDMLSASDVDSDINGSDSSCSTSSSEGGYCSSSGNVCSF